ncbi:hypothetical protein [Acidithiobacillus ferrooxidans]|uniref:hypothetical protein n=1 Tax=Acidithiobacillus ferrooxidans TaxID=920 RepID=UPI0013D44434|nr:hypothetical protein [Acidithiobacillus ferrooxidans]
MMNASESVQAVLAQLNIRRSMPKETRSLAVMDDKDGKSFFGLMVWNIGTLIQDKPELIASFMLSLAALLGLWIATII